MFSQPLKAAVPALLLLLAACGEETKVVDLSAPSFDKSPVFRLNVASVKVVDEYQPPFGGNHVEHLFATSPARGVGIWTNDRLQAAGPQGNVEVHITDASVVETKGDPFDSYEASVAVDVKLYDGIHPLVTEEANATAHLTKHVKKTTSITERENLFAQMTRDLTASLDQSLDSSIRQHFGPYIIAIQNR